MRIPTLTWGLRYMKTMRIPPLIWVMVPENHENSPLIWVMVPENHENTPPLGYGTWKPWKFQPWPRLRYLKTMRIPALARVTIPENHENSCPGPGYVTWKPWEFQPWPRLRYLKTMRIPTLAQVTVPENHENYLKTMRIPAPDMDYGTWKPWEFRPQWPWGQSGTGPSRWRLTAHLLEHEESVRRVSFKIIFLKKCDKNGNSIHKMLLFS